MKTKQKSSDMQQDELTQFRFCGSEVPGMEYTTALPIGQYNAAPAKLPPPDHTLAEGGRRYKSKTEGKRA